MKTEFEHKYHLTQHVNLNGRECFVLAVDCIGNKPIYTLLDENKREYWNISESELSEVKNVVRETPHKYKQGNIVDYSTKRCTVMDCTLKDSKPVYLLLNNYCFSDKEFYKDIPESELSEVRFSPPHTYKENEFVTYKGLTCCVVSAHFNLGRPVYNLSPFVSWFCQGGMVTYRDIPEYEVKEGQKPNPYSKAKTASTEDIAKAITQVIEKHPKKSIIAALFLVGLALIDEKK